MIDINGFNGTDTDSCLQGKTPCATLNMALNGSLSFNGIGNTTLYISPGNYTLEYGDFNNINFVVGNSFAIIGSGELETIVECDPGAGLNIYSLDEVTIQSITFIGCGFENKLAICFKVFSFYSYSYIPTIVDASPATLTFLFCSTISVYNVTILSSNGSGIIVMDTRQASIIGCTVSLGYYLDSYSGSLAVGGIVSLSLADDGLTRFLVAHSTITDNNYLVNQDCTNIKATGAIVVASARTLEIDINSCLIANNSRALFSYHSNSDCDYIFNSSLISNNRNASIIRFDEVVGSYTLSVLIIDTELADSDPLIIHSPPSQTDSTSLLSKAAFSCSKHQRSGYSDIHVCVSNPKLFSFDFKEMEECKDYEVQPECIDYACSNIYSVCFVKEVDNCTCYDNHYNETNYCGECKQGYSVAINSPYLECVPCNSSLDVLKGWVLFIVLEFIPLTVMIALIAILNVNLNQGSLKAYILFCQLFTIPIPSSGYPSWIGLYNYTYRIRDFALLPFTIWNLGFISFPSCNLYSGGNECSGFAICISQNTTPLGAIAFWYVIAFYPFMLLAFVYGYVIMYNNGFRCVTYPGRPVHRFMATRFWRTFDIQPSLSHTVASVYMLCFTQLVAISLKLLNWSYVSTEYDTIVCFLYDCSQKYFDKTHCAAFFAGLFVLIVFVFLPVTYLCVYPFKWFQKCLNKLKFKKDLVVSVTDVFIGPYKNGTDGTWDYRFFAGLAFALQLSQLICLCFLPAFSIVYLVLNGLYTIFLILFRPYKRIIHIFNEVLFQLVLIGFGTFPIAFNVSSDNIYLGNDMENSLWLACICFLYFFLVVTSIYCFVWILRKIKYAVFYLRQFVHHNTDVHRPLYFSLQNPINEEEENDMEFADRLMNPQDYNEHYVSD